MSDARIARTIRRSMRPPSRVSIAQAVDGRRMLVGKAASEPGPWRNSRTPYLVEPMSALSPSDPCHTIVMMGGVQWGKTELGLNWEWYIPQYAPGPMMHVLPTEEIAKRVVNQRFDPMVEASPELARFVSDASESKGKKRGKGKGTRNRAFEKNFPGGVIFFAWSESPAMLRSMPAKYLFIDEADAMHVSPEGDPIELARARQTTFARSKSLIVSTPTLKDRSRIEAWFKRGDQRRYFVPCPFCDHRQTLRWEQIRILARDGNNLPATGSVRYECESCNRHIEESAKQRMIAEGEWRPTAEGEPGVKSYHLPGFCSPWMKWENIARSYVKAVHEKREKRDPQMLVTVINTMLGEPYDDTADESEVAAVTPETLAMRAEDREPLVVPYGAHLITIGVDVQGNRIEVSVYAWGQHDECWLLHHEVFWEEPDRPGVWDGLDALLERRYASKDGRARLVVSCAIDTGGHRTQEVYDYVARRNAAGDHRVMAVKGANTADAAPIAPGNRVEVDYRGRRVTGGVQLWLVGTHKIKATLRRRFAIPQAGPGYFHMLRMPNDHDGTATYALAEQLLSERPVEKRGSRGGSYRTEWVRVRPSQAAEAWDCYVYAYAAALRGGIRTVDWATVIGPRPSERDGTESPSLAATPQSVAARPYPAPAVTVPPRRRVRGRSRYL